MLTIAALLVPFMTFLFWSVVMLCIQEKSESQKKLTTMLIIAAVYFFIDAFYLLPEASSEDYSALVFLDILSQFITVSLPTSIVNYILSFQGKEPKQWVAALMYAPGLMLGTAAVGIYSIMGAQNAATFIEAMDNAGSLPAGYDAPIYRIHEAVCQKAYNVILLTEVLATIVVIVVNLSRHPLRSGSISRFIDRKGKLPAFTTECILLVAMLGICAIRIALGRHYLISVPSLSGLISIILGALGCLCAYIGAFFPDREFDLWDIRHPLSLRASETGAMTIQKHVLEEAIKVARPAGVPAPRPAKAPAAQEKTAPPTLLEQFSTYMVTKKPYLNPDLSITDVAYALRSNRTYISVLINENFEKNFRDYINDLRVQHSKQIMLKNPDEVLEVIAEKSGFSSDSQYAKKFKEIEGITPKQWLAKQLSLK